MEFARIPLQHQNFGQIPLVVETLISRLSEEVQSLSLWTRPPPLDLIRP